ncbi:hypothetical protein PIB30_013388 [Stylosanthes scabra]|uniref:F-box domain-containing protein n=1 Tax=Stylosanthes scabra TaxID=79078 RepID=A0ABU6W6F0_9FABA|nr:hypothetical protein [Stylosanthes scabra]
MFSRRCSGHESFRPPLPHLPEELLWKVFLKSDPKTVGRCRALNKSWDQQLNSHDFIKQHWDEKKLKRCSIIIGVGQNQTDNNSEWFFRAELDEPSQLQLNIPSTATVRGYWYGIHLPVKGDVSYNPSKYLDGDFFVFAFGFPKDSMDYRIVHAYKSNIEDPTICFKIYHPIKFSWSESCGFKLSVSKIGPNHVVEDGIVH